MTVGLLRKWTQSKEERNEAKFEKAKAAALAKEGKKKKEMNPQEYAEWLRASGQLDDDVPEQSGWGIQW